jgi:hypothetical protein
MACRNRHWGSCGTPVLSHRVSTSQAGQAFHPAGRHRSSAAARNVTGFEYNSDMPEQPAPPTNQRKPSAGPPRPQVLPLVPGFARPPDERRPLPDAGAVRRLPLPDFAPPYDDELPASGQPPAASPSWPAGIAPAGDKPAAPANSPAGSRQAQDPPGAADPGREPPGRPAGPGHADRDPAAASGWPGQFAQVLAETLAGSRPPRQIVPWTTEQARRHIRRLGPMLAAGERPVVRRVVASHPAADVVEMTIVVRFGPRVRALAIRLERDEPRCAGPGRDARAERWLCTAVEAA